jgi:hypothetical protein
MIDKEEDVVEMIKTAFGVTGEKRHFYSEDEEPGAPLYCIQTIYYLNYYV